MLTLVVCLVLGVVLLGVIKLANNEGQMTGRSQNWNAVLPIVEAGIEEALTHLKHSPSNRTDNNWTYDDSTPVPRYIKTRTFKDGFYQVTISTNWDPVITSRAGIRAPLQTDYSIFRTVRVRCTNMPLFTAAIEAVQCIDLTGNGITFNSYDSMDPNFSGPGGTYDPNKVKAGGDVVCYGDGTSIDIGNADIAGKLKTGPDTTYEMGPNASVGDLTWSGTGIQPGYYESVPDTEWPDMTAPLAGGAPPRGTSGPEKGFDYVLSTGIYRVDTLNGQVYVKGDAILVVNRTFRMQSCVIIPGARVRLYVFAADATISGVANQNTDALRFMYFGMPSNLSISISGNSSFCGVLYAPNAILNMSGGGSDTLDFSGSIVAKCVKVNGHFNFHFDEALRRFGSRGIFASSWDEITPETTSL